MVVRLLRAIAVIGACAGIAGCSGAAGVAGLSSISPNIYGVVSSTNGSFSLGFSKLRAHRKLGGVHSAGISGLASCTVTAYDISTGLQVGSPATTNIDGEYTLLGVESGETYKVVADCGASGILTSVATADSQSSGSKDPVVTDPVSTVIAAMIIQAIVEAVDDALGALPGGIGDAVKDAVKGAILGQLQTLMASIETTVNEAIASGSMTAPNIGEATIVGGALASAGNITVVSDFTGVLGGYTTTNEIPTSVSGAVSGAKTSAGSMPSCDSTLNTGAVTVASPALCTRAVAKLMFNSLHFTIALNGVSGVFLTELGGGCNSSNAALTSIFSSAEFIDGGDNVTADPTDKYPDNYCLVKSKLGISDRNRGIDEGGDDDHGPLFGETGDLANNGGSVVGVLTALGQQMYDGVAYHVSDIDQLVFSYNSGNGAGMNSRLIAEVINSTTKLKSFYYLNASSSWVNTSWVNTCDQNYDGVSTEACEWWNLNFGFTLPTWSSAANNGALATAIGNGSNVGLNVFLKKFGGAVPSMAELDQYIDSGRIHIDRNPTGQKEFNVLYSEPADYSPDGNHGCFDNDPSTACYGQSGITIYPAVRVNISVGSKDSEGMTRIISLSEAPGGKYFVRPIWNMSGFSRVFQFIGASDGRLMRDELLHERGLMVITDAATQCGVANHLPNSGANCANEMLFNVTLDWSGCESGPTNCPSFNIVDTTSAVRVKKPNGTDFLVHLDTDYNSNWFQYSAGVTGQGGHSLLGTNNQFSSDPVKVTLGGLTIGSVASGLASSAGEYNIAMHWDCSINCTVDGFYLVDSSGVPYQNAAGTSHFASGAVYGMTTLGMQAVNNVNVVKYVDDDSMSVYDLGNVSGDWDANSGGSQNFDTAMLRYRINSGPVPNPNYTCSQEPFYIDKNNNGKLDCNSGDNAAVTDVAFSDYNEYTWWVNDPRYTSQNRSSYYLSDNQNGYAFADPIGTKNLLTTAFGGWFDGAHSIGASTNLNSMQVFGLIYIFFTEGNGGERHIDGMSGLPTGSNGNFRTESPLFDGEDGEEIDVINKAIGSGIMNIHQ